MRRAQPNLSVYRGNGLKACEKGLAAAAGYDEKVKVPNEAYLVIDARQDEVTLNLGVH